MNRRHPFTRVVAIIFVLLLISPTVTIVMGSGDCDDKLDTDVLQESIVDETTDIHTEATEPTEEPTEAPTEPPLIEEPLLYSDIVYKEYGSIADAEESKNNILRLTETLHNELESGKYSENACEVMYQEIERLQVIVTNIENNIKDIRSWDRRHKEYPYATSLWKYLKSKGYSDVVCAGILGNFMTETGGQTLKLQPHIYDSTGIYYGLAQWSGTYHADVRGLNFEFQCEYIERTLKQEFDRFGYMYKKGFDFEDFQNMTSPKDAAMAFAKCYERCTPVSYSKRQNNAVVAYKYFTE